MFVVGENKKRFIPITAVRDHIVDVRHHAFPVTHVRVRVLRVRHQAGSEERVVWQGSGLDPTEELLKTWILLSRLGNNIIQNQFRRKSRVFTKNTPGESGGRK